MRSTALRLVLFVAGATACRDAHKEAAARSEQAIHAHVRDARAGLDQLTRGFVPVLEALAPSLVNSMTTHNVEDIRFTLLGMNTEHTPAGSLAFFPTGFIAAVGPDGVAIARNIDAPNDVMRGTRLAALFPVIVASNEGHSGLGVGELPATPEQPARAYLVAAAPVRAASGAVLGSLVAGISYGQIARSLDTAVRMHAGQEPVLWVGLRRNRRVFPSGHDRDVPPRWLIPDSLIALIPADADRRVEAAHGEYTWTFVENGERGWAGVLASAAQLADTQVVIFRSEGEQR